MLLRRFLNTIKKLIPRKYIKISPEQVANLDPDKITVENVRSILNSSYQHALDICETGVKEGIFDRKIAIYRPDGSIDLLLNEGENIPETIHVYEEIDGHYEEEEVSTKKLKKATVYSLAI